MAESMLLRISTRRSKLLNTVTEVRNLIQNIEIGIELKSICRSQHILQTCINMLREDTKCYLQHADAISNPNLIKDITKEEMDAEDLVAELVAIQKTFKWDSTQSTEGLCTKLPKITLPKFEGDITKWYQFWDRFEACIHSSTNLSDADKLAYLMGCLDGSALDKLVGLSTTNINYNVAIKMLQQRYGSKKKLMDSHYDAIFKLKRASPVTSDCRKTLDEIEKHLRILKELGEDTNGNQFRSTILDKFPEKVLYQINLLDTGDDSIVGVLKNLETIITALENSDRRLLRGEEEGTVTSLLTYTNKQIINKQGELSQRSNADSRFVAKHKQQFNRGTTPKRCKSQCIFCKGDHFNDMCDKVTSLDDRRKKLIGRCFVCFRKGHNAKACLLKKACVYCHKRHNRALCTIKFSQAAASIADSNSENNN